MKLRRINKVACEMGLAMVCFCALSLGAKADMSDIPVPEVTLEPGHRIEISDLASKSFYVSETAARLFAVSRSDVEGKVAKRALLKGKPIALSYLRASGLVIVGAPTQVIFKKNGLSITALLVPLQPGVAGQTIDARNPDTGKIVKATVTEDGLLQVPAQ